MGKNRGKINHLPFMDDLKLHGRNMQELDSLVQSVRIFSADIGMAFGIEKCAAVKITRGKVVESEGIELPNGDTIKGLEENDGYKYLGILECDKIKNSEMKEKIQEYFRRVKLILKSKLNAGNVVMAVNSRAVSLVRYCAGIVEWTKAELQEMDRKTRKIFTMNRSLHPRSDVDRLYIKRTEGGRGLQCLEEVVKLEELSLAFYLSKKEEKLLKEVVKEGLFREIENPKERKRKNTAERRQRYEEKVLHGQFERATKEVKDQKGSWLWLNKGYLKKETEGLLIAAQDQALRTNWIRRNIDKENISAKCRLCGENDETIAHVLSECKQLAQNEYKKVRHDKIAAAIHWHLSKKYGFQCGEKSYQHFVSKDNSVLENDEVKILWDFSIQTEQKIEHNRPDITIFDKKEKQCYVIDVACPFDTRIQKKEKEKVDAYTDLKYEILKVWRGDVKKVIILPVIIGALGSVTERLQEELEKFDYRNGLETIQKTCLLGSARIVRKVLDTPGID